MVMDSVWPYISIFVMAATPWLEILLVIPIGAGMGLHPLWVGVLSFLGNYLPLFVIFFVQRYLQPFYLPWYRRFASRRRKLQLGEGTEQPAESGYPEADEALAYFGTGADALVQKNRPSRKERAVAVLQRYGIPGLAFSAPLITGVHLAAVIAIMLNTDRRKTAAWMGLSLAVWTLALTALSFYGARWIGSALGS